MDPDHQKLMAVFRAEVAETLDELAQAIEGLAFASGEALAEAVANCMRFAHNIKGAAAIVDSEELAAVAHALEDSLGRVRDTSEVPQPEAVELLLESVSVMQRLADDEASASEVDNLRERLSNLLGSEPALETAGEKEAEKATPATETDRSGRTAARRSRSIETVRVESSRLDRLMGFIGELLVINARFAARGQRVERFRDELLARLRCLPPGEQREWSGLARQLESLAQADRRELLDLAQLTGELAAAMKRVRMMPLSLLGSAWRRSVREAAQHLAKHVRLSIEVGDVELDRQVLDRLRDPIAHLLRNAVDHGIEAPGDRLALGKPEYGTILVRSVTRGSVVRLEISDDGGGISLEGIGGVALARGMVTAEELGQMNELDRVRLLFEAGFTTAEGASQISGRGVGLESVHLAVSALGGTVEAVPRGVLGGATFVLTFPVTLVSTKGLLVRTSGAVYALPVEHVDRTLRIRDNELLHADGAPAIRPGGGDPIRVRWLASLMGVARQTDSQFLKIVVVSRGQERLGLVVDEILKEEEYVAKKLPWNLRYVEGVDGAVILPDGSLAVAVDVPFVFEAALSVSGEPSERRSGDRQRTTILVVDDSLTSRTLMRNALLAAGYEVVLAAGGTQAWQTLQEGRFDLLVTDIQMPNLDGIALTRRIRKDSRLKDLPVVLVTSLGKPEDISRGAEAGADEYVVKGDLQQQELLEAVARLV